MLYPIVTGYKNNGIGMGFNDKIPPDLLDVLNVSGILEITEFELFGIAYERWYGKRAGDIIIEPFFNGYMFHDIVPFWVREFTRLVLRLDQEGILDPRRLGIQPHRYEAGMAAKGVSYFLIATLFITGLVIVAEFTGIVVNIRCFFPPCY